MSDNEGTHTEIILKNVIYFPESPKNLIFLSRWSGDRGDNFWIITKGEYSIFYGNMMSVKN